MKVSIIIPVFNVEQYISDCLNSVANQTYTNIECIIVNDCSLDRSIDIANEYILNYNGSIIFKIVNRNINGGLSEARNTGILTATGDYLFFLDSDDEIFSDTISYLVEKTILYNSDLSSDSFPL